MDKTQGYLFDIQHSCQLIEQFIEGKDFVAFSNDLMCQDAILRRIEIIGEASNKLDEDFKNAHPEILWHLIRGMRNRLVHDYNEVDLELVWHTIQTNIPELKVKMEKLLK